MFTSTLFATFCLGLFPAPADKDETPKDKPVDQEIIVTLEKLGGEFGRIEVVSAGRISFVPEKNAMANGLPAFRFRSPVAGAIGKLAAIDVPFGIYLPKATDEGLTELKELKNLTTLYIAVTSVSDAGLKELKSLKKLTWLNLNCTKVTDAGLGELKELKNLTTLTVGGTKVTDAGMEKLREALPKCKISR